MPSATGPRPLRIRTAYDHRDFPSQSPIRNNPSDTHKDFGSKFSLLASVCCTDLGLKQIRRPEVIKLASSAAQLLATLVLQMRWQRWRKSPRRRRSSVMFSQETFQSPWNVLPKFERRPLGLRGPTSTPRSSSSLIRSSKVCFRFSSGSDFGHRLTAV